MSGAGHFRRGAVCPVTPGPAGEGAGAWEEEEERGGGVGGRGGEGGRGWGEVGGDDTITATVFLSSQNV